MDPVHMKQRRKTKSAHGPSRRKRAWTAEEARARLGHLLDEAASGRPQRITRRGKTVAVLVAVEKPRTKPKTSLLDFFMNSPLAEYRKTHELEFERNRDTRLRRVDFGE